MKYHIDCYNTKNQIIYKIDCWLRPEVFEEQIKQGYLKFSNQDNLGEEIICYLGIYNKIVISKGI